MSVAIDQILEQASHLDPHAQRELLTRLAELVGASHEEWEDPADKAVIRRFPRQKQWRMDYLADQYNESELSPEEEAEYLQLVDEVRRLTVENIKALARRRHGEVFTQAGELKRKPSKRRVPVAK